MASLTRPRDIYVVGAQNTGKTTLVKALESHFKSTSSYPANSPHIIMEVARSVLQHHKFTASDIRSSASRALELQHLILQAQLTAERVASADDGWLISDRSGVDPIAYARKYVSEAAFSDLIKLPEWLEMKERMSKAVVIVCEAGADWLTDDGVRLMPESREDWIEFHRLFCRCLDDLGINFEILPCTITGIDERVRFVLERQ